MFAETEHAVNIYRQTSIALGPMPVSGSMSIDIPTPQLPARIRIALSDTVSTGSVTVVGTCAGISGVSEVLTFTKGGARTTERAFSAWSSVTTAGLTSESEPPTITGSWVGADGSAVNSKILVVSDRRISLWETNDRSWSGGGADTRFGATPGGAKIKGVIPFEEVWSPREGDIVVDFLSGEQWMIEGAPIARGMLSADPHYRCTFKQRQGSV